MSEQATPPAPVSKLTIHFERFPGGYSDLEVRVGLDGNLVMDGADAGESVRRTTGDWDYEYSVTVESQWVHTVMLHLLKERFATSTPSSDFMAWLKAREIPYRFWSWA